MCLEPLVLLNLHDELVVLCVQRIDCPPELLIFVAQRLIFRLQVRVYIGDMREMHHLTDEILNDVIRRHIVREFLNQRRKAINTQLQLGHRQAVCFGAHRDDTQIRFNIRVPPFQRVFDDFFLNAYGFGDVGKRHVKFHSKSS